MNGRTFFLFTTLIGLVGIIGFGLPVVTAKYIKHISLFDTTTPGLMSDFLEVSYLRFLIYVLLWILVNYICYLIWSSYRKIK